MDRRVTFGGLHHLPLVNMGYPPLCKQALSQESVNKQHLCTGTTLIRTFLRRRCTTTT